MGPDMSDKHRIVHSSSAKNQTFPPQLSFLSYESPNWIKLGQKGHLNTRNKFRKRFFSNPNISLPILDELEESRFWGKREKSTKSKGLQPWIHCKVRGR
jgi:hypothetical protein